MSKKSKDLILVDNSLDQKAVDQNLKARFARAKNDQFDISDFVQSFIGQFVSPQTKKAYLKDLMIFFNFLKAGDQLIGHPKHIEAHHFQVYRDYMIEQGLSSATVNRRLVCIRSFMKWSLAAKLIDHNPLDVVKLPKVQTEAPTLAFDDTEVVDMINSPNTTNKSGLTHRMILVMLFTLGLRRSELVNITLSDFYEERGHRALRIKGKGGKERHLPINDFVYAEIQNYIQGLESFGVELEKDDYFIQSSGKRKNRTPMDGSSVFRVVEKYKKILGITKRVSPHSCRATAISHLLDTQKTPIRDVAIFAGHSKITTTERYDKRRKGLDDSAAYQVNYLKKSS